MKIVVDTNCIISALIKDGVSRRVLTSKELNFISPDFVYEEIISHVGLICEKSGLGIDDLSLLLNLIFGYYIEVVPKETYEEKQNEAVEIIGNIDVKDVPFVSCALALNANGIWSDDAHFEKQTQVKIYKTQDLMKIALENI